MGVHASKPVQSGESGHHIHTDQQKAGKPSKGSAPVQYLKKDKKDKTVLPSSPKTAANNEFQRGLERLDRLTEEFKAIGADIKAQEKKHQARMADLTKQQEAHQKNLDDIRMQRAAIQAQIRAIAASK